MWGELYFSGPPILLLPSPLRLKPQLRGCKITKSEKSIVRLWRVSFDYLTFFIICRHESAREVDVNLFDKFCRDIPFSEKGGTFLGERAKESRSFKAGKSGFQVRKLQVWAMFSERTNQRNVNVK